ncbi:hypothetical protein [Pseudomonas phage Astolliot]|nr:hypothetical protein [Pseudomonas phage Astolliot]
MIITGIGTRYPDHQAFQMMVKIAKRMAGLGWSLRSGGAIGSDSAWEQGWSGFDTKEIYLAAGADKEFDYQINSYDMWMEAQDIASRVHPVWERLSQTSQDLHTRNIFQVLGLTLDRKSDILVAYAEPKGHSVKGGTATAYNLAKSLGVPVYNLYTVEGQTLFYTKLAELYGGTYTPPKPPSLDDFFEFE